MIIFLIYEYRIKGKKNMEELDNLIITVRTKIQENYEKEFNEWQFKEHIPWILSVPGYISVRRYSHLQKKFNYMNIWTLKNFEAHDCEEHEKKSKTPWGCRLKRYRKLKVEFYHKIKSFGFLYTSKKRIEPRYLYIDRFDLEKNKTTNYLKWIYEIYLPELQKLQDVQYICLYEVERGSTQYMIRYDIDKIDDKMEINWSKLRKLAYKKMIIRSCEGYKAIRKTFFSN